MPITPYITPPRDESMVDRWRQRVSELLNQISDGLDVRVQDQFTEIIDLHLSENLSDFTITVATSIDDTSVTGDTDGVYTPLVGDLVCLKEGTAFYQGDILSVTPNGGANYTLELDTPLDFAYTTVGGCSIRNLNLAVDGSVTPRVFSVGPQGLNTDVSWDICRLLFSFVGPGTGAPPAKPDDTNFGTQAAVTKGIVVRQVNGITKNIWNAKTNADMKAHMYDVNYTEANKAGEFGATARRSFNGNDKNGVVVRLSNTDPVGTADELQIIVQDNLSTHTLIQAVAQGHVVDP